ncbi:MAG: acyl-CoA desaturase [Myxococcaceae bacterium]|nr:acyl-CoA desaturase [Myxococcaceae bacterium]
MTSLRFAQPQSAFRLELTRRVDAYFADGRSRHADARTWAVGLGALALAMGSWALLVFGALPAWLGALLSVATGFFIAQVGFNLGHDAIHGALSRERWVNGLAARAFDLLGASSRMWAWAHNGVHHTFTNVPGADHDLEPAGLLHLYRKPNAPALVRFQHLYAWPLYGLTMLSWVFLKDFVQLASRRETTRGDVVDVVLGKALHVTVWLVLPLLLGPWAWWQVLVGYGLAMMAAGFTAAVVFQLAHVVEGPQMPRPDTAGVLADDFFVHQLRTTANFAPRSALVTALTGGLNHQVEHHLFPRICHTHYPALSAVVEACAREFGVPYHVNATFFSALASHARVLRAVGGTGDLELSSQQQTAT